MPPEWWIAVGSALGVGFLSGLVPVTLAEATAMGAAAVPNLTLRTIVIVAFTVGHVAGKAVWYWLGTLESKVTRPSVRQWIDRAHTFAARHPTVGLGLTASSATVSLPPFHLMVVVAGITRSPAAPFFAVAFVGRLVRFTALAAFPSAMKYLFVGTP